MAWKQTSLTKYSDVSSKAEPRLSWGCTVFLIVVIWFVKFCCLTLNFPNKEYVGLFELFEERI